MEITISQELLIIWIFVQRWTYVACSARPLWYVAETQNLHFSSF